MANKRIMTPEEKVLLQAKHRLEEIEARNRKKERNAGASAPALGYLNPFL